MVSVIVANYNGAHLLGDCLESLQAQDHADLELLVLDNGSIDESRMVCARYGVPFIELGRDWGLSVAFNRGAALASGRFLFFASSDMRFERACVGELYRALWEAGESAFAADPLQFNWTGTDIIHFRAVLRRLASLRGLFSAMIFPLPPLAVMFAPADAPSEIPWGCAGSLMVDREKFEALDRFDESFFLDFEDVDLCWRAWLRGWRTVFVPSARLYHRWGASTDEALGEARADLGDRLPLTNWKRLVSQQKNYQRFVLKVLDPLSIALVLGTKSMAVVGHLLAGRPEVSRAILRAFALNALEIRDIMRERERIKRTASVSTRALLQRFSGDGAPARMVWPTSVLEAGGGVRACQHESPIDRAEPPSRR